MSKEAKKLVLFLSIMLCALVIAGIFNIVYEFQGEKEKTYPLTGHQIMVIWENGYKQGRYNTSVGIDTDFQHKKDSIWMSDLWKD